MSDGFAGWPGINQPNVLVLQTGFAHTHTEIDPPLSASLQQLYVMTCEVGPDQTTTRSLLTVHSA